MCRGGSPDATPICLSGTTSETRPANPVYATLRANMAMSSRKTARAVSGNDSMRMGYVRKQPVSQTDKDKAADTCICMHKEHEYALK